MSRWQSKAAEACRIRDESLPPDSIFTKEELANLPLDVRNIPRSCGKLSQSELVITENYDATALLELLETGSLSAKDVLNAFRKRAAIAQQLTNCVTELLPEAIDAAEACDQYLQEHGRPMGPLHGLPISLKEQFGVAGHRTNGGFVAWIDNMTDEDCEFAKTLKQLGAVVFARTMEPQALMHIETDNNIYGTCVSPFDRRLTSGGSSGGEAVLMALNGTPLGIGGDIGGSIRSPAALNGIYGFKPTAKLISGEGVTNILPGADAIMGTLGPFTRSRRDLDHFLAAYSSALPWIDDPSLCIYNFVTIKPFATRRLRIGVMAEDGVKQPSSAVARTLDVATKKLSTSSVVELVPFSPFKHDEAWSILRSLYFEGCERKLKEVIDSSGEPMLPLTEWILERGLLPGLEPYSVLELQVLKLARDKYRRDYSRHWNSHRIDVVLTPVGADVAQPHNTSKYWGYTAVWNLLDYPGVSFPASSILDASMPSGTTGLVPDSGDDDEDAIQRTEPRQVSQSLPVGLQIIGKRFQDNEVLAALAVIEDILRQ